MVTVPSGLSTGKTKTAASTTATTVELPAAAITTATTTTTYTPTVAASPSTTPTVEELLHTEKEEEGGGGKLSPHTDNRDLEKVSWLSVTQLTSFSTSKRRRTRSIFKMSPWLGNSGSENAFFLKMIFIFIVLAAFFGRTLKMSANAQDG